MKKNIQHLILLGLLLAPSVGVRASFRDRGWSARSVGMGGAFSALANDSSALFTNPAGTAWLKKSEASFLWDQAYVGLGPDVSMASGLLSLVVPTRWGAVGGGITSFNASGLLKENVGLFHYARRWGDRVSAGLNVKYLTHDYTVGKDGSAGANPVFANGTSADGYTVDAGVMVRPVSWLSWGLTGRNLTEPDVGLASTDRVPAEYQTGVAYRPNEKLTIEVDASYRHQLYGGAEDKTALMAGVERWFISPARVAGVRFGASTRREITGGLSLLPFPQNRLNMRIDYAFSLHMDLIQDYMGSHKVSLSLLFGRSR